MRVLVMDLDQIGRIAPMSGRAHVRALALVPGPHLVLHRSWVVAAVLGRQLRRLLLARPSPALSARLQGHANALVEDLLDACARQLVRQLVAHRLEVRLEVVTHGDAHDVELGRDRFDPGRGRRWRSQRQRCLASIARNVP
jgi:hypothetical protein